MVKKYAQFVRLISENTVVICPGVNNEKCIDWVSKKLKSFWIIRWWIRTEGQRRTLFRRDSNKFLSRKYSIKWLGIGGVQLFVRKLHAIIGVSVYLWGSVHELVIGMCVNWKLMNFSCVWTFSHFVGWSVRIYQLSIGKRAGVKRTTKKLRLIRWKGNSNESLSVFDVSHNSYLIFT